ncbi:MAG: RNA polymerase sigma factor [Pyrinomonadaceae bacterium]
MLAYAPGQTGIEANRMSREAAKLEKLLRAGVARLVARAGEAHGAGVETLLPRVRATVEKYLLRDRPDANDSQVDHFLDALRADDLCLAAACERGDDAAWHALMGQFRATVMSAARGACGSEDAAEELAQSVWAELYGLRARADGAAGAAGKLAYYSGCGSLGGWLRAVVGQLAVDRHRKTARLVQTEEDADFDRLTLAHKDEPGDHFGVAAPPDPERALMQNEAVAHLRAALAEALGDLEAEDKLLVKLYYFDGLRLREAGAVLGVHEATASRRLTRLHADIRKSVTAKLISRYGWTTKEAERSLAEAAAGLDADLGAMLVADKAHAEAREELFE